MFSNLSLMFKLNVVAIIFGEIWQLRECSSGAILLVFVDNRANFPTHTMHRSAVRENTLLKPPRVKHYSHTSNYYAKMS